MCNEENHPHCMEIWRGYWPRLDKLNDTMFKSDYGYYMRQSKGYWTFFAFEKEMDANVLYFISETLKGLNEHDIR